MRSVATRLLRFAQYYWDRIAILPELTGFLFARSGITLQEGQRITEGQNALLFLFAAQVSGMYACANFSQLSVEGKRLECKNLRLIRILSVDWKAIVNLKQKMANIMPVRSIVNYKNMNEADLKKWLVEEFGYDDQGNPRFTYRVCHSLIAKGTKKNPQATNVKNRQTRKSLRNGKFLRLELSHRYLIAYCLMTQLLMNAARMTWSKSKASH